MGRMGIDRLIEIWAKEPSAFERETDFVQRKYGDAVEAKRVEMGATPRREQSVDAPYPLPHEMTVRELEEALLLVDDIASLEEMYDIESETKARSSALDAIKGRMNALAGE